MTSIPFDPMNLAAHVGEAMAYFNGLGIPIEGIIDEVAAANTDISLESVSFSKDPTDKLAQDLISRILRHRRGKSVAAREEDEVKGHLVPLGTSIVMYRVLIADGAVYKNFYDFLDKFQKRNKPIAGQ